LTADTLQLRSVPRPRCARASCIVVSNDQRWTKVSTIRAGGSSGSVLKNTSSRRCPCGPRTTTHRTHFTPVPALYRSPWPEVRLRLLYGDLLDGSNLASVINMVQPDEVYNLGAQSHVRVSFDQPIYTVDVDGLGTLRLLEAVRNAASPPRFYQASSSEMYGKVVEIPQTEKTPFYPRSPYACAKAFGFWQTINYREAYGLFACNGILFNHGSPRRGETFVSRKITRAATRIKLGLQDKLYLGNIEAQRDWGFAGDYVNAIWLMMQQDEPDDYVIATGEAHSVREFLDEAFGRLDLDWHRFVEIDPRYFRPTEVDLLLGDASKARNRFGWEPKVTFKGLARMMVDSDMELAREELLVAGARNSGPPQAGASFHE